MIEENVTYQALLKNSLVILHLLLISINTCIEQNYKYLLSETLFCVHEENGNFMRLIDFLPLK